MKNQSTTRSAAALRDPIYKKVKDSLVRKIRSGELRQGELIPGELQLAKDYGCGRLTMHRALREMAEEGFVERRRRAGTRVAKRGRSGVLFDVPRIDEEITKRNYDYRYELLQRDVGIAPEHICERLGVSGDSKLLHIVCRHWANDRPFQLESRWINLAAVPEALDESFADQGPNRWLLDNVPFSDVEHEITATVASPDLADKLQVKEGAAVLEISRRTTSVDKHVTCVKLHHPGDLYVLSSTPQVH